LERTERHPSNVWNVGVASVGPEGVFSTPTAVRADKEAVHVSRQLRILRATLEEALDLLEEWDA
jgi:hypothetical protein